MKKLFSKIKMAAIVMGGIAALLLSSCSMIPKKNLHGEKLLKLSDDQLFEAVYSYNLDLVESYPSESRNSHGNGCDQSRRKQRGLGCYAKKSFA